MKGGFMKTIVLVVVALLLIGGCTQKEEEYNFSPENKRFQGLEKLMFLEHKAQVVVDSKTGIKYLYIWDGGTNGGPAVTRLWEK